MKQAIEFHDVAISLDHTPVLKGINVQLETGKVIGLLGPSGAGKTTLIRSIVGRQHITNGTVLVLGRPAGSPDLRKRIGYMTQSPAVYEDLTTLQNMRYFASMRSVAKDTATALIDQVDLRPQSHQIVATLSGGQRSRLSLAVAMLGNPDLLVLDEPTVGVDPALRKQLWDIFHRLATEGKTLLISSHVMDEAAQCDDLLLIRDGSLLAHDSPHKLCRQTRTENVEEAFLALIKQGASA